MALVYSKPDYPLQRLKEIREARIPHYMEREDAGMVAFFLGLIEAAQLFLPGRVAESTDPVLALILGLVIRLLSVRGKPA